MAIIKTKVGKGIVSSESVKAEEKSSIKYKTASNVAYLSPSKKELEAKFLEENNDLTIIHF